MKISEKQLMILFQTIKDTLIFHERPTNDPFCFNHQMRLDIYNEILNQQSNELIEVE